MKHVSLVEKSKSDDYIDYNITCNNQVVGTLDIRETIDFIFIRYIKIIDPFREQGYARTAVDLLRNRNKVIRLAISGHSKSAAPFWESYFKGKVVTKKGSVYFIEIESHI